MKALWSLLAVAVIAVLLLSTPWSAGEGRLGKQECFNDRVGPTSYPRAAKNYCFPVVP